MSPDGLAPARASRRPLMVTLLALAIAVPPLPGCSDGGGPAAPVDPSAAREALNTALESWKNGDPIDGLKSATPPIVAQDFDWMAGHMLVRYELTDEGKDDGANLRIPVTLT